MSATAHLDALRRVLADADTLLETCERWGAHLAADLPLGARLLAAGNGGSAAEAQHLTAELVGRYRHDRIPLSAIALHADTSALTACVNDFGVDEAFARQVRAHARPGDVLVALSTSGRSRNVVRAVEEAHHVGCTTWALTGPSPNPLADTADEALTIDIGDPAVVQELHLVAVHLVCEALDDRLCNAEAR